jgi:putative spermidine/putrescine transport system permease protein
MASDAIGARRRTALKPSYRANRVADFWLLFPATAVLLVFFIVPVALIVPESLYQDGGMTLGVYWSVVSDPYYALVLWRSLWLSFASTVICILLGYPIAYYATRIASTQAKRYIYMIILAPLFTSAVIRVIAWIVILGNKGIVNTVLLELGLVESAVRFLYTEGTIMTGLVYTMIPFAVLTIAAVLENIDGRLEEAARDLGATPLQTFLRVTLPLSVPGVSAGAILVFSLCLSAYVTPALLGGGRIKVLASIIFEQFLRTSNWALGSAISCLLLLVTGLIIYAYGQVVGQRITGGQEGART